MCNVASDLPAPPSSAGKAPESHKQTSFGDVLRAKLGIREHKLCKHGSYGPTCSCDVSS
jgi:hypothetical protein